MFETFYQAFTAVGIRFTADPRRITGCGLLALRVCKCALSVAARNSHISPRRARDGIPRILMQARDILERFMDPLSCTDQCFIADSMLEELPTPSSVGKTKVGGIDLNKARMRWGSFVSE